MLQLLETFCAVAQLGSLTRAAESLSLTQPAVTRQLRALERQLGAILVTRTPRGILLTPAGEAGDQCATLRLSAGLMATLYVLRIGRVPRGSSIC